MAVAASLVIGLSVSLQRTAEAKAARASESEQRERAETNASLANQEAERANAEADRARDAEDLAKRQQQDGQLLAHGGEFEGIVNVLQQCAENFKNTPRH